MMLFSFSCSGWIQKAVGKAGGEGGGIVINQCFNY